MSSTSSEPEAQMGEARDLGDVVRPRLALLVDGENVSHALAGRILTKALAYGDPAIMRVYGNAAKIPNWDQAPRFRLVHSDSGKNATDMLLVVEAMALAYDGRIDCFCIASSDRDFTHLVLHLREKGHQVIGMGEEKADAAYRKAFAKWEELAPSAPMAVEPKPRADPMPARQTLDDRIFAVLKAAGGSLEIGRLGAKMHAAHGVKISQHTEKTWRAYLVARTNLYRCDPRGPRAQVHLAEPVC
jgi:hypothetical protein